MDFDIATARAETSRELHTSGERTGLRTFHRDGSTDPSLLAAKLADLAEFSHEHLDDLRVVFRS